MKPRHKRLAFAAVAIAGVVAASVLVVQALQSNTSYFFSPTKVHAGEVKPGETFRLGGMVLEESLQKSSDSLESTFVVTDKVQQVKVSYTGILPDLFKEGQGTVAKGELGDDGVFYAEEVLAKHDESYMPPEVTDALKKGEEALKQQAAEAETQAATITAEASPEMIQSAPIGPETPLPQVEIK